MTLTYWYRDIVERGNGKPSYDWHEGWSENSPSGNGYVPWMTGKECQADAKARGAKAVFERPDDGRQAVR